MKAGENREYSSYDIDQIARRGHLREALEISLNAIKTGVYQDDLFFIAADIAYQLGDLDKAAQLINRLLGADPEHINGWVLFGDIFSRKEDASRAAYGYQRAENLFPAMAELNREIVAAVKKKITIKTPKKKEPAFSDHGFDTATFAGICVQQGYFNKALKIYYQLLKNDPENVQLKEKIRDLEKRLGKND